MPQYAGPAGARAVQGRTEFAGQCCSNHATTNDGHIVDIMCRGWRCISAEEPGEALHGASHGPIAQHTRPCNAVWTLAIAFIISNTRLASQWDVLWPSTFVEPFPDRAFNWPKYGEYNAFI